MIRCIRNHEKYKRIYNERHITTRNGDSVITFSFTPEDSPSNSEKIGELLIGLVVVTRKENFFQAVFIQQMNEKGPVRMISNKTAVLAFIRTISRLKTMTLRRTI